MNTATHTPTPWAEQEMPGGCNDRITDTDGEGKTICEFPYGLNADSAFIVRAVNAHDELLAALKELVSRCDGEEGVRADGSNIQTMRAHAILEKLEAA